MLQLAARYSAETEAEVIQWFQALLQKDLQPGMREMEKQLKDGVLLVEYVTCVTAVRFFFSTPMSHITYICRLHIRCRLQIGQRCAEGNTRLVGQEPAAVESQQNERSLQTGMILIIILNSVHAG